MEHNRVDWLLRVMGRLSAELAGGELAYLRFGWACLSQCRLVREGGQLIDVSEVAFADKMRGWGGVAHCERSVP